MHEMMPEPGDESLLDFSMTGFEFRRKMRRMFSYVIQWRRHKPLQVSGREELLFCDVQFFDSRLQLRRIIVYFLQALTV